MSQKQYHSARKMYEDYWGRMDYWRQRCMWLERRPPWWMFWAVRRWRKEEPERD